MAKILKTDYTRLNREDAIKIIFKMLDEKDIAKVEVTQDKYQNRWFSGINVKAIIR